MKINDKVKIIRKLPEKEVERDARDYYLGEIGTVSFVNDERKVVLVSFPDNCQIHFRPWELEKIE